MTWSDQPIENDELGIPKFKGKIALMNDKNERLASICWFFASGPFYAFAMDVSDVAVMRRIGPCTTLDGAKHSCLEAIEGRKDISDRAGYPRVRK